MEKTSVDLGFLADTESWLLTNKFFPSKVGGQPAWLDLQNIPKTSEMNCAKCNEPLVFLCQVYASNDKLEIAFHRTIFVFICRNGACCVDNAADNIRVFRSQLPHVNDFYGTEAPDEDVKSDPIPSPIHLCRVCGHRGPHSCAKCRKQFYCGAVHQRIDWRQRHKKECEAKLVIKEPVAILFPEKELEIEVEELESSKGKTETSEEAEARRLQEYEDLKKSGKAGSLDVSDTEMEQYGPPEKEDMAFTEFRKKINRDPDQVLRYDRGGTPLWITDDNQLKADKVPPCDNCNGPRTFEFQIMPQLLISLAADDAIDWGIIAVYTCAADCDTGDKYVKEFAYKQDLTKDG